VKTVPAVTMMLLLAAPVLWAGGEGEMELRKQVVIDDRQAAALTNRVEILLQGIRIPETRFLQAGIADIIGFFNSNIRERGATDEARQIVVTMDRATEKELTRVEVWEGGGGLVGVYTFGGLDLSVLEAVQLLQNVAHLDRRVAGNRLILSLKRAPDPAP
jgi:hypothetical protein